MKTVEISMKSLNGMIDSINGAVIGVSKELEKPYNHDGYVAAMNKLSMRINDFMKVIRFEDNRGVKNYIISALEVRTMRFSKSEVKVLSGSAFRKWFKEGLMRDRLSVEFKVGKDDSKPIK